MKFNKFVVGAIAMVALAFTAIGQPHQYRSLLASGVGSVMVSNTTHGVTNFTAVGALSTNVVGSIYTNTAGVSNYLGAGTTVDLLSRSVGLWSDRNGSSAPLMVTNNLAGDTESYASIMIGIVGTAAAANSALTFSFWPLPDGTNETTTAGDAWIVGVTANGVTPVLIKTNLPAYLFKNCRGIHCKFISNADVDADSEVFVYKLGLIGFVP